MSKRYPGNFVTGNPVALSQTSNNGIWDTKDNYHAVNSGTWQEVDGIYEIGRSLRFRNSATAYLNRTFSVAGNRRIWTWSAWVKRGSVTNTVQMFACRPSASPYSLIYFASNGTFQLDDNGSCGFSTVGLFRDPTAWYHLVISLDTTQANQTDRIRVFVNGVKQTCTYTIPAQNAQTQLNTASNHTVGKGGDYTAEPFDGCMSELNFVDGQSLDPSYFGYFDPNTNIWMPKRYTGGYGTNGFYLPFSENQTLRNLGRNFAGGTNFAPYSESIASWGNNLNCTITSNSIAAPNGTTTADTITASSSASAYMRIDTGINMGISTHYTMSVYLKAGTATTATLSDGYGTGAYVTVNLTSGAVTVAYNPFGYQEYTVTNVGNGWYRVTNSFITHSSGDYNIGLRIDPGRTYGDTGASGASVYAWGAQINLGKTADPYFSNDVSTRADSNWTLNSFSLTAGTTYDSMVDSPTNIFTTATDVGGVVPGNYCTINASANVNNTTTNGNLSVSTGGNYSAFYSSHAVNTGKWYFEITKGSTGDMAFGLFQNYIYPTSTSSQMGLGTDNAGFYLYYSQGSGLGDTSGNNNRVQYNNTHWGAPVGFGDDTTGTVYGVTLDFDTSVVTVYRNNDNASKLYWTMPAALTSAPLMIGYCVKTTWPATTMDFNFGQRPFAYTPPTGFKSLNTTNLQALGTSVVGKAAIQANKWFDISIYGGTSSAVTDITNSGFKPDLVWIKNRSASGDGNSNHMLFDTARGGTAALQSDQTAAEAIQTNFLTAFNENGFRPGTATRTNETTAGYVAWQWKQSPTAGFNVVSYTGNGASSRTISHNLGVAPKFIITKSRGTSNWWVYHQGQQAQYPGQWLYLNLTFLSQNTANAVDAPYFKTDPTSSVFSIAGDGINTNSTNYISYLWAEVPGFSKFGSYAGNGSSDGTFVYTGFRPKYVLFKPLAGTAWNWNLWDTARNQNTNPMTNYLAMNNADAEGLTSTAYVDYLANGFKLRNAFNNTEAVNYVYVAFAESPFALNNRAR